MRFSKTSFVSNIPILRELQAPHVLREEAAGGLKRRPSGFQYFLLSPAGFDAACPDAALPIRVSFRNDNNVAVQRLTYTLEGFEPAFRASVSFDPYQVSERRIEAGETFSACRAFRMRNNERVEPQRLEWRVTVISAEFD